MILQLFWLHVTSPRLHLLSILFFCNAKDCQMVKSILSSIKTVALVQLEFEFKRGHIFIVAKIDQTNFVKSRKMQGSRISSSWIFVPCVFSSQNSPKAFSIYFKWK